VIQEHSLRYPIRLMGQALAVSPDGYNGGTIRPESVRGAANRALVAKIRVDPTARPTAVPVSGTPWSSGVSEHRIARLMRIEGIRAKTEKK
jgi:putative transposase